MGITEEYRIKNIVQETHDQLYSVLFSLTHDAELSKDVMQEAYIRLWQHRNKLDHDTSAIFLLRKYARNLLIDHFRKELRKTKGLAKLAQLHPVHENNSYVEQKDTGNLIRDTVNRLPAQQQLIFRLHKEHNLSYKEIAAELNITTGTIEKQMNRALKFLRKELVSLVRIMI